VEECLIRAFFSLEIDTASLLLLWLKLALDFFFLEVFGLLAVRLPKRFFLEELLILGNPTYIGFLFLGLFGHFSIMILAGFTIRGLFDLILDFEIDFSFFF